MECSQRNGMIDGYRLVYYPTRDSSDDEAVQIDGSNTNTYTIVGLQPRVKYTFKLAAFGGNYSYIGPNSTITATTSVPQGIVSHKYSPIFVKPQLLSHLQLLDFSSMVECMATTA